jgi:hypothetical protein
LQPQKKWEALAKRDSVVLKRLLESTPKILEKNNSQPDAASYQKSESRLSQTQGIYSSYASKLVY